MGKGNENTGEPVSEKSCRWNKSSCLLHWRELIDGRRYCPALSHVFQYLSRGNILRDTYMFRKPSGQWPGPLIYGHRIKTAETCPGIFFQQCHGFFKKTGHYYIIGSGWEKIITGNMSHQKCQCVKETKIFLIFIKTDKRLPWGIGFENLQAVVCWAIINDD